MIGLEEMIACLGISLIYAMLVLFCVGIALIAFNI